MSQKQTLKVSAPQGVMKELIPLLIALKEQSADQEIIFGDVSPDIKPLPNERFLSIRFRSSQFVVDGEKRRAYSTILVPRAKASFSEDALKGIKYTHGDTQCSVFCEKSRRRVVCHAASEAEGRKLITEILTLFSTDKPDENTWRFRDGVYTGRGAKKPERREVRARRALFVDNTKAKPKTKTFFLSEG